MLRNIVYLQTDVKHVNMKQTDILTKLEEDREKNILYTRPSNLQIFDEFTFPIYEIGILT